MKLEVGMYVRLYGKIGKIEHICMCEQCELRGFYEPVVDFGHNDSKYISVYWKDDLKASHKIKDLIKVGDYVNGFRVVWKDNEHICINAYFEEDKIIRNDNKIKSIVTKEQFESMAYKVGE